MITKEDIDTETLKYLNEYIKHEMMIRNDLNTESLQNCKDAVSGRLDAINNIYEDLKKKI